MQRADLLNRYLSAADLIIILLVATAIYGLAATGSEWRAEFHPVTVIDLSIWSLPRYTILSASRGIAAYVFSLGFTLITGYIAAKSRKAERIIVPLLDILQSIPVLGFLPGLVLALVSIFPKSNVGLELTAILMIFTGQVWNMTFSFYASLKALPSDLVEASTVIGLDWRQRLLRLELPFSAMNLAWNSLLSMAGGWFFLSACESSTFGDREYQLPGLGSYMAVATRQGDGRAIVSGIVAMTLLIVSIDFLIWKPILSWVQKYRLEEGASGFASSEPLMGVFLRESRIIRWIKLVIHRMTWRRRSSRKQDPVTHAGPLSWSSLGLPEALLDEKRFGKILKNPWLARGVEMVFYVAVGLLIAKGCRGLFSVLRQVNVSTWVYLCRNTLWTFIRVVCSLLISTAWALPVGIWLATSQRRIRFAQPIIQVLASFPAPMIYPLALGVMFALGISFDWASMLLMLLGVQWYVLFNVMAGALRIPRELRDSLDLMQVSKWDRWRTLYLPSVFPALVTGWVTAAGGAWNASIVAEVISYGGRTLSTAGIGATISVAAGKGDFPVFAAGLAILVGVVLTLNRLLWGRLYQLAQTRFRMDA